MLTPASASKSEDEFRMWMGSPIPSSPKNVFTLGKDRNLRDTRIVSPYLHCHQVFWP